MRVRWNLLISLFLAFVFPYLVGLPLHRQGFNLLDDGLWLLGTRVLLEGGTLYGDLFSIYGPARYFLLLPFFLVLGKSALTLAIFKAVIDGIASAFGWWYTRRLGAGRWAWLIPLGVTAIGPVDPRYLAAAVFACLVGCFLQRTPGLKQGLLTGVGWGALSLFGLDMAGYGAVILLLGWFLSKGQTSGREMISGQSLKGLGLGLASVAVPAILVCLGLGILETAVWDTVVYPATRFGDAMGVAWYESFIRDPMLHQPFAGHHTGESLAGLWAGHAGQRALAVRSMFLLVWLVPAVSFISMRRTGDFRPGPLVALAAATWVTIMARGDVSHLRLIWFATLLLVPVLVAYLPGGRVVRGAVATLFLVGIAAPLAGENIWLATHLERPGLVRWDRPTAEVHLAAEQMEILEAVCAGLPWDGDSPVLVWPVQPGLQFVLGAPLATAQATLLPGEVKSTAAVLADLERSLPPVAVFGSAWGLVPGVSDIRGLEPEIWSFLRHHYLRHGEFATDQELFLTAVDVAGSARGGKVQQSSQRLPGIAQLTTTGASASIGPGVTIAQSFTVEDFDLGSVELLFRGSGPLPCSISFTVTFTEVGGARGSRQLLQFPFQVTLEERTRKIMFSFPPIAGTTKRPLLMEITGHPAGTRPFSLLMNQASEEVPVYVDYYPGGQAYFGGRPLEADLYFVTY